MGRKWPADDDVRTCFPLSTATYRIYQGAITTEKIAVHISSAGLVRYGNDYEVWPYYYLMLRQTLLA